mmetsp:Transcript_19011/g.45908  ORF Transcript_19011/g.45908 Transcript_19011/m.45908 type:complete len:599 (+) Transcript_19011:302-2098(+)
MKTILSLFLIAAAASTVGVGSSETETTTSDAVRGDATSQKKGTTEFDQDPLLGPYIQKEPHPHIQQRKKRQQQQQQLRHQQHYSLVESFDQDPLISPYLQTTPQQQQQQQKQKQKQRNGPNLQRYPANQFLKLQDPYSQVNLDHRRRLLEQEDLTIYEKKSKQWRQEQPDIPDVDPYLQRRLEGEPESEEQQQQQRELKIPVGIPVYNPRLCSTKYAGRPILLPRPEPEPEPADEINRDPTSSINDDGTATTNSVGMAGQEEATEPTTEDGGMNGDAPAGGPMGMGGGMMDGGGRRLNRRCRRCRRHRNLRGQHGRDLEVPPGVIISTTTTCYTCDGEDVPAREDPTTGDGAADPGIPGLPDDGPPPPPASGGDPEPGTGADSTPLRPVGIVSIPTTKSCEAEHLMLGCGYNVPAGAVPASWLPYVGLTTAYTGQLRLQCVCSPKDMVQNSAVATTRQDENLVNDEAAQVELISAPIVEQEYVFECLVYPLEPLFPEATVPDRDGGGVGTVTAANIVPSGCQHVEDGICPKGEIPLSPGSTLPGSSNVQCGDTAATIDHNSGCTYTCQDGRMIQCMCAGDKTGNNRPKTWYCRNFVGL